MTFAFCKTKRADASAPKRQRSKLQRASRSRVIGAPTGFKVNPLPNPGEPGFDADGAKFSSSTTRRGFDPSRGLVPIAPVKGLRPISMSFLAARDPDATALESVRRIMDVVAIPKESASLRSAKVRSCGLSSHPLPPIRAPLLPPPLRNTTIHGENKLPRSLATVVPDTARAELAAEAKQAVHSLPLDRQDPEPRYQGPRPFRRVEPNRTQSREPSPSSSKTAPAVLENPNAPPQANTNGVSFDRLPDLDPHSFELYQEYKRTGKIRYCIPESAPDENNKYTWQHCWSLINAYIHGTSLGDVDFADRVMDILDSQIVRGVYADYDTIRHVFTAGDIPEQLKRFVVNRCVDAGADNFRREKTRRLPKLYVLMVLETAMGRKSLGAGMHSATPVVCEYHLHGRSRRCYKVKRPNHEQKMRTKEEEGAKAKNLKSTAMAESERESAVLVGTAEAVRMVKVNGRSADVASMHSATDSVRTVNEVEIKIPITGVRKDEMPRLSKHEYESTSFDFSGLEGGRIQREQVVYPKFSGSCRGAESVESDEKARINEANRKSQVKDGNTASCSTSRSDCEE